MGQEIPTSRFSQHDFARFSRRLREETALFGRYLQSGRFDCQGAVGGFELEAWLVDRRGAPSPINEEFLKRLHSPLVVSELSSFNIEINGTPQPLKGRAGIGAHLGAVPRNGCSKRGGSGGDRYSTKRPRG
jgi:hypothetical protein